MADEEEIERDSEVGSDTSDDLISDRPDPTAVGPLSRSEFFMCLISVVLFFVQISLTIMPSGIPLLSVIQ